MISSAHSWVSCCSTLITEWQENTWQSMSHKSCASFRLTSIFSQQILLKIIHRHFTSEFISSTKGVVCYNYIYLLSARNGSHYFSLMGWGWCKKNQMQVKWNQQKSKYALSEDCFGLTCFQRLRQWAAFTFYILRNSKVYFSG